MVSLTAFLRDFFCLANAHHAAGEAGDGRAFERRVERHLAATGVRPVDVFSGVRSLGSQSLSGLYHQIDATGRTHEAVVIGEWKAYRGSIPKNDLLRFKAATDDYWLQQHTYAMSPVIRVFGGTGHVSPELRRYAAQWGICLITPDRWPAPILAAETTSWPEIEPDRLARRYLTWLSRPLNVVCTPQPHGGWLIPRLPTNATIDHFLAVQDRWSDELWRRFHRRPGSFERWLSGTIPWGIAA
ncbi:hypothetical protein [Mesorhizobium sp.]|uniref:hypothetical protein n=1 Tax=Mesorhizobium sp. TaxID=1871066 RepID=UPI000FE7560D|nr:hypothetical protein [Mesorhizobium sp.]RWQ29928.1 MAG: hypothetical protein EOS19_10375 [Mesorhizobium sp.]